MTPKFKKKFRVAAYFKSIFCLLLLLALWTCSKQIPEPEAVAIIGDRIITAEEFIERAELTPRQPYCSSNTPKDKAIILNTLIAEKLLSLEMDQESALLNQELFQAYLKGRKEQFMREMLFYSEAYNKVNLDSAEIVKTFALAGREYDLEFYSLDSAQARILQGNFDEHSNLKPQIFDEINLADKPPQRKLSWNDSDTPDIVQQALFTRPITAGQVVGPLPVDYNKYLVIKVIRWTDTKPLGGIQAQTRWNEVTHKLKNMKASSIWTNFTNNLMQHKKIEFDKNSFPKIFRMFETWLVQTQENNQSGISLKRKNDPEANDFALTFDDKQFLQSPFCKINDDQWFVNDFRTALMSHPLVFREKEVASREALLEQFKLALADLIKDQYITREAYKKSIDKTDQVRRHVRKWQDALVAVYHRDKFIKQISQRKDFDPNRLSGSHTYFDDYLDSLKQVYDSKIKINMAALNKIKLTSAPMFVTRPNLPYIIPTPAFPLLTDNARLDFKHSHDNAMQSYSKRTGVPK
ncbi:MAG: hypothetical protein ACOY90_18250 [Candidatus Zhuqueibacterota bacterium]